MVTSLIDKGREIFPTTHLATSSVLSVSGWRLVEKRSGGMKGLRSGGGLPMGELYVIS